MPRSADGPMMWRLVVWRLALALPLLAGVATLNFALVSATPGDPVAHLFGEGGTPDEHTLAELRARLALDRPAAERYMTYLSEMAKGHLGQSILQGRPVLDAIA